MRVVSSRRLRWVALCGVVGSLGLGGGCTNSDDLNSGVSGLAVQIELTNTATRFANAGIFFRNVTVRSVDPVEAEATAGAALGILTLPDPIDLNFNSATNQFETSATLPQGRYLLESIILIDPIFKDGTSSSSATCAEFLTAYPSVLDSISLRDFGREVIIDVSQGGNQLRVVVDGAALLTAFQSSWTCRANCIAGFPPRVVPWCIQPASDSQFDDQDFASLAPTFIQIQ